MQNQIWSDLVLGMLLSQDHQGYCEDEPRTKDFKLRGGSGKNRGPAFARALRLNPKVRVGLQGVADRNTFLGTYSKGPKYLTTGYLGFPY